MSIAGDKDATLGRADAETCRVKMRNHGVRIGRFGLPSSDEAPDVLAANAPSKRLLSGYLAALAERRRARLENALCSNA